MGNKALKSLDLFSLVLIVSIPLLTIFSVISLFTVTQGGFLDMMCVYVSGSVMVLFAFIVTFLLLEDRRLTNKRIFNGK